MLPNALLALYYGFRRRPDVVYSSQVGDGHICIPLCIGLFAMVQPLSIPEIFNTGLALIALGTTAHLLFAGLFHTLPRWFGALLILTYGLFLFKGFA